MASYRNNEGQFPELTVKDVQNANYNSVFHEEEAADFINERRLNRVDKSKGESVAKNLEKAMDVTASPELSSSKVSRARKKSLNKTHNPSTNQPYSSYEKYGDKYDKNRED